MAKMTFQFTGNKVTGNDTACFAINLNDIQHLMAGSTWFTLPKAIWRSKA